ncbi:hypothetical protein H4S02_013611 [Coemansia sp. RSA 2611]|nr:hypothetical protein H4S02_013611 [Coemansia sp. RSA 2611]
MLSPMAPSVGEELWEIVQKSGYPQMTASHCAAENGAEAASVFAERWPKVDETALKQQNVTIVVQVNGKVRFRLEDVEADQSQEALIQAASEHAQAKKWLFDLGSGQQRAIRKVIHVPNKIINIII